MGTKRERSAKSEDSNSTTSAESLGLEAWIEIHGKRAPEEEVDGKRVVVMEANEPKVTTPYSIFVKNNTDSDLYVRLDTDKKRGGNIHLVKKRDTREYKSFNGALLGFEVVPLTVKHGASDVASQLPPKFRHFAFQVKSVKHGPPEWVFPMTWAGEGDHAFGSDSGGTSHAGLSCKEKLDKKKVELVSAGRAPESKRGYYCRGTKGEKLGKFKLYYASVTEMAVARNRRSKEEEQATSKVEDDVVILERDHVRGGVSVKSEAKGEKMRPRKKLKVQVIIDVTSDEEIEVD